LDKALNMMTTLLLIAAQILNPILASTSTATPSIALISHTGAGSGSSGTYTTTAINTTGANFIIAQCPNYAGGGGVSFSDSLSNTWIALTSHATTNWAISNVFYSYAPTVGTSHTFTCAGTVSNPSIQVAAFSGVAASIPDQQTGTANSSFSGTTFQPGLITPTANGELVISAVACGVSCSGYSINGSFTTLDSANGTGSFTGGTMAYLIQTMAGAINPTTTIGTGSPTSAAGTNASFQ
jgi:hypothetical protein